MPPKMGMDPILTRGALAAMLAQAAHAHPQEACGLLLGLRTADGGERITTIRPAANVAPEPVRHFEIDPAVLIAAYRDEREGARDNRDGLALLGWYHSHPSGGGKPSLTDQACALGDGRLWAIIAQGAVHLWRDGPLGFEMLPTRLGDS